MFASFDGRRELCRVCFILVPIALIAGTLGASSAVVQAAPLSVTFSAHTDYAAGQQPRSAAMGDVNGDTFLDLATANFGGGSVSVLLGNGAGGFGPSADLATGAGPHSVAMGDVNGDTFLDLATANFDGGSASVLLGNGAGGFAAHADFIMGGAPISVAINDLNGDTRRDLAVANWYSQTVQVLLGDGTGGFAAPAEYPVNGTPHSVAVRDLNGDLVPDLAVANGGTATVSVLLGDGAGGFGGHIDYATGAEPRSVVVADVNGDLVPDLATANSVSSTASVLLGNGTGGFGAQTVFATGGIPFSIAVGDLNGDLLLDLATANAGSSSVSVLLGDGTGGFGTQTDFATGSGPESVAVGDLNGDLRLDVGAANRNSNSVSVLVNTTGPPTVPGSPHTVHASVIYPTVTVSWTAASDGGSPLTGYVVTPYVDGIPQSPVPFMSTATAETVTGLTDGVTYTFTVAAINDIGTGPDSTASNPVTVAPTAPGPPIIGTATAGNGRATVSWTAPALDGGSPITGYIVTPFVSTWTGLPRTFNSTATTQTVTGLTNGWPYRFRVQAINALGTGSYSAETNRVTPSPPPTVPGSPNTVHASVIYPTVTVSWTAPAFNGGSSLTGYVVTPYVDGIPQSPVPFMSTATAEAITGLTDGVTYTFTVAAINAAGTGPDSAPSNPLTVAPTAPGPPIIGTATAGNGRATVSWTAPALDGGSPITGYIVTPYVSTWTGLPRTFNSTATTQTVTGLTNGWPYRFRVQAINALGTGSYSAETNRVTPTAG